MISVVGAGPAGCIAAAYSSKKDETFLYECQKTGFRRVQCSGLVSKSGLARLGINSSSPRARKFVLNQVRGARIHSPEGSILEIDGRVEKAVVLDRRLFDDFLMEEAIDSGAKYVNKRIGKDEAAKTIDGSEKTILASGSDYGLQRFLGLDTPKKFLYGAQYEMSVECDSEFVEMYLNVPGFFSWLIPAGDYARVGLCTTKNPTPYLEGFVKRLRSEKRLQSEEINERNYGVIPIHDPGMRTQYEKLVLVGDAAGQVKATTGGGIVLGGLAAKHACEEDYERLWRKEIGRELRLHLLVRSFLDRLSPRNLDRLVGLLKEERHLIEEEGDMDYASPLVLGLASDPVFLAKLVLQAPFFLGDVI